MLAHLGVLIFSLLLQESSNQILIGLFFEILLKRRLTAKVLFSSTGSGLMVVADIYNLHRDHRPVVMIEHFLGLHCKSPCRYSCALSLAKFITNVLRAHLWLLRGLVKIVPAAAYHLCLNLPSTCLQHSPNHVQTIKGCPVHW